MFTRQRGARGARGAPEQRELCSWSQGGRAVQGLRRPKEATGLWLEHGILV